MKQDRAGHRGLQRNPGERMAAKAHVLLLAVVCFALGSGTGAFLFYRAATGRNAANTSTIRLSEGTRAALKTVRSPVELRFYSILTAKNTPEPLKAFAVRVDRLLSEYEKEAGGRVHVTRHSSASDVDTAAADGIRPFDLDKGQGFLLGITVAQQEQRESLSQLAPEWEPALESDLTRAILRVANARSVAEQAAANAETAAAAAAAVRQTITNYASVPLSEGRQILREATLKDLRAALNEIEAQLKEAQMRLAQAQSSNSETEQQAALKAVEELQARQSQKIKELTTRFQAQSTALERLNTNR